jgi:hypothetical protein
MVNGWQQTKVKSDIYYRINKFSVVAKIVGSGIHGQDGIKFIWNS